MKMLRTWSRRSALAAAATVVLPRFAVAQPLQTVVVGGVVAEDTVPVWYALSAGLFRRAGLNVEFQKLANGSAATLGVVSGAYNIANTNSLSVLLAHAKSVPVEIVVFSGMYNGTTEYIATVVRKESPLQTAADLAGRTLGTTGIKDLSSLALLSWMDQRGADSKTLKVIEVPFSVIAPALEDGRIDVGTLLQPFLNSALASGKVRIFANSYGAIAPRFAHSLWVTNPSWAVANADAVRRFARVVRDAQIWCNEHRPETASIMAQNTGADIEAITHGGRETFTPTFADPKDLQPLIDVAVKYGALERRFDAIDTLSPAVRGLRG
jgi:NitT/TauT family transport system substrate-binding protein